MTYDLIINDKNEISNCNGEQCLVKLRMVVLTARALTALYETVKDYRDEKVLISCDGVVPMDAKAPLNLFKIASKGKECELQIYSSLESANLLLEKLKRMVNVKLPNPNVREL